MKSASLPERKKKIAVVNSPFTSHIGRMIHVFEGLRNLGHEIQFWGSGGTEELAGKYGFRFFHVPLDEKYIGIMQEDLKSEEYYTRVFFPMALDQLPSVLELCEKEKPDLLEANTRVFAGIIASELTGIPLVTHCCSGNSFAQAPEDYYGFCVKGDESERLRAIMLSQGKRFFSVTDDWYNAHIAGPLQNKKIKNAVGLRSPRWAIAHSIRELSKPRIADLPEVILTGPIIGEEPAADFFAKYEPYCYMSLGTCPWEKERIKSRYLKIIECLPEDLNVVIGLGSLFAKEEFGALPERITVFDNAPQLEAIKHSDFVICHGGCQTVHEALYFGKPVIGIPHYAELSEMVNSVENVHAGVRIPPSKIGPHAITKAVEYARSDLCRGNAQKISGLLKASNGLGRIVDLLDSIEP
jgi:UDP:flavonoid glycosyltransferase YjiC (YdhE family)